MATSWQDIRDEIVQEYGYLTTDTNLIAKVFNWEKDAVRVIVSHYPWWWLQELVASVNTVSTQNYTLLGVPAKVIKLYHGSTNSEILEVDPKSLIEQNYNLTLTGKPIYFWVTEWIAGTGGAGGDVKVQWYPVPDAIYAIKIFYKPFELGALVDTATVSAVLPIPGTFVPTVKEFVRSKFSHVDGDLESSGYHMQQFQSLLNSQVKEAQRFNTRRLRLKWSDIPDDGSSFGPRLDPNHFE